MFRNTWNFDPCETQTTRENLARFRVVFLPEKTNSGGKIAPELAYSAYEVGSLRDKFAVN